MRYSSTAATNSVHRENHQYYDEKQARKPKVQKQNCGVSSDTCYYKQDQKARSRHGKEVSTKVKSSVLHVAWWSHHLRLVISFQKFLF